MDVDLLEDRTLLSLPATVVHALTASYLTEFNGAFHFATEAGLWRSDGTEAGTRMIKAISNVTSGQGTPPSGPLTEGVLRVSGGGSQWKP